MKKWLTKSLEELLLTLETGSRPKGGVGEIFDGIPSVSGEHINRNGEFYWDTPKHITRDFFAGMKRGRIQPGDILIVKDGATTGKTAMVRDNFPFKEAAINEHVFLLRTDQKKVLPEFVGYFLFGPIGQQQILSSFRGAAIGGIPQDFVRKVQIPLAPLADQERIVKLLDESDALRKLAEQAHRRTDALIPALFNEVFGDPITNQKSWPRQKLADVCAGKAGIKAGPFGSSLKKDSYTNKGPRVYGQEQVIAGDFSVGDYHISEAKFVEMSAYVVEPGDLLISLVGTIGKVLIVPDGIEPGIINPRLLRIRPRLDILHPCYLEHFLTSQAIVKFFSGIANGVTMGVLNGGMLKTLDIPLPPLTLQKEFAQLVNEIRAIEVNQATSRTRLDALFQSMLYRAFNGELIQ